jgi:hypothetical protein
MVLLFRERHLQEFITNQILMNEDIERNPANRSQTPTWIVNNFGVKSCWPLYMAKEMVENNYGWSYAESDEVPAQKEYPLGIGELTASGLERRRAATESKKVVKEQPLEEKVKILENMNVSDLRTKAKRAGIDKYWVKSETRLLKELAEKEA